MPRISQLFMNFSDLVYWDCELTHEVIEQIGDKFWA